MYKTHVQANRRYRQNPCTGTRSLKGNLTCTTHLHTPHTREYAGYASVLCMSDFPSSFLSLYKGFACIVGLLAHESCTCLFFVPVRDSCLYRYITMVTFSVKTIITLYDSYQFYINILTSYKSCPP